MHRGDWSEEKQKNTDIFFGTLPSGTVRPAKKNRRKRQTKYSMYYLALSETKLETVPFEPSAEDTEDMIQEIYQKTIRTF